MSDYYKEYERKCYVYCKTCKCNYDADKEVKFVDISEDIQGKDVLTFQCFKCGMINDSFIRC